MVVYTSRGVEAGCSFPILKLLNPWVEISQSCDAWPDLRFPFQPRNTATAPRPVLISHLAESGRLSWPD